MTTPPFANELMEKQHTELLLGLKSLVALLESGQPVPGLFFYGVKKVNSMDKPDAFTLDDTVGIIVAEGPHADMILRQLFAQCADLMEKIHASILHSDQQKKKKGPLDVH